MTPSEHLTAAATQLRELAAAATPGEWLTEPLADSACVVNAEGRVVFFHPLVGDETGERETANAALIATLACPPVALALADWLEHEARHYAECVAAGKEWRYAAARAERSLAVADLILPADSDRAAGQGQVTA